MADMGGRGARHGTQPRRAWGGGGGSGVTQPIKEVFSGRTVGYT